MSDRAFLLDWEDPSVVTEYRRGMTEGFFANLDIASTPQFMHRESKIETQNSFRPQEVEDCRMDITGGRGDACRIEIDPSELSASIDRTANESVMRSSTFEEARMSNRIGTTPAESALSWLEWCNKRPKIATTAFFLPQVVPSLIKSTKDCMQPGVEPINLRYSGTEER